MSLKMTAPNAADFYKSGHIFQYPKGTSVVYANFTARSDRLAKILRNGWDGKITFFGLQGFAQWYLIDLWNETFFNLDEDVAVSKYYRLMKNTIGHIDVEHIRALHKLGYLPLKIKALPEGSRVDIRVPVFTIINTLPEFFWVTNYVETVMSCEVWKPTTTATIAYEYRRLLERYAALTGASMDLVQWQGHDFSMRGLSGLADAYTSSPGHLLSFTGTDVIPAIEYLETYYGADIEKELVGSSVPATEHSVMCMGGKETEYETFRRLIEDVYPSGIVSIVSDTWDFWKVITETAGQLKEKIMARDGKVVFRPDSGDPVKIISGYRYKTYATKKEAEEDYYDLHNDMSLTEESYEAVQIGDSFFEIKFGYWASGDVREVLIGEELRPEEVKGAVECLAEGFGTTRNDAGFMELDYHVGLIYGDSITLSRAEEILERLKNKGFASTNVVFGIGSYTYQYNTRDTFGFAVKSTYGEINNEAVEIFKDPVTDSGTKKSAKGLLRVEKDITGYVLHEQQTPEMEALGELKTVFLDGQLTRFQTLSEIRGNLLAA